MATIAYNIHAEERKPNPHQLYRKLKENEKGECDNLNKLPQGKYRQ